MNSSLRGRNKPLYNLSFLRDFLNWWHRVTINTLLMVFSLIYFKRPDDNRFDWIPVHSPRFIKKSSKRKHKVDREDILIIEQSESEINYQLFIWKAWQKGRTSETDSGVTGFRYGGVGEVWSLNFNTFQRKNESRKIVNNHNGLSKDENIFIKWCQVAV